MNGLSDNACRCADNSCIRSGSQVNPWRSALIVVKSYKGVCRDRLRPKSLLVERWSHLNLYNPRYDVERVSGYTVAAHGNGKRSRVAASISSR